MRGVPTEVLLAESHGAFDRTHPAAVLAPNVAHQTPRQSLTMGPMGPTPALPQHVPAALMLMSEYKGRFALALALSLILIDVAQMPQSQ